MLHVERRRWALGYADQYYPKVDSEPTACSLSVPWRGLNLATAAQAQNPNHQAIREPP